MALLIHRLGTIPSGSMVLLDEPEISLHPGAQQRLLQYLLNMSLQKRIQIVVSTHSPEFVRDLPSSAIKLFRPVESERFEVIEDVDPWMAFHETEMKLGVRTLLRVEDDTAKRILDKTIKKLGSPYTDAIQVFFEHGGASTMWKHTYVEAIRRQKQRTFFIFDGDQNQTAFDDADNSNKFDRTYTLSKLESYIRVKTNNHKIEHILDSNSSDSEKKGYLNKYLDYHDRHVRFLPKLVPEDMFWNAENVKEMMHLLGKESADSIIEAVDNNTNLNAKGKIEAVAIEVFQEIKMKETIYSLLIERWYSLDEPPFYDELCVIIKQCYQYSPQYQE